jgi:hypothetical protein
LVNGSVRLPYDEVSQPATGQTDGVAAASALRRSTLSRTESRRLPITPRRSLSTPSTVSGEASPLLSTGAIALALTPPPMARDLTLVGSLSMARLAFASTAARSPRSSTAVCSADTWLASCPVASR